MLKAVFLDRDGVINRKAPTEDEYVTRWEEMEILPGVAEAIALLQRSGFQVYILTNQRSVAKGLLTIRELEALHEQLCSWLAQRGAGIDGVYYCPHDLAPPCDCRKPKPGMILRAAREHNVELRTSWMVGDSISDMEAGRQAGCQTVYVSSNGKPAGNAVDLVAPSLLTAAHRIRERTAAAHGDGFEPTNGS